MIPVHPGGDPEVPRSEKSEKKIPEKPDFPDPDFRISVHAVAKGGPKATCSQNFKALAAIVPEMPMAFEVDNYILDDMYFYRLRPK